MKPGNRHMRGANSCRIILKDEDLFYFKRSSFIEGALILGYEMWDVRYLERFEFVGADDPVRPGTHNTYTNTVILSSAKDLDQMGRGMRDMG